MTRIQHCCSLIGVACLLIVVSGQAWSQETPVANASAEKEDSLALQEVTVVARRREESLQRIPDSVTAFQAADLERAQVDRVKDFAAMTPNLRFSEDQEVGAGTMTIRGVTQNRGTGEPPVSITVDGVQMTNNLLLTQDLYDLGSIEVLRGPQGALYGRNAIGGAIVINSTPPTNETHITVKASVAEGQDYKASLGASGAIVDDKLLFRISGHYHDREGQLRNVVLDEKVDYKEAPSVRGRLLFMPNERLSFDLRHQHSEQEGGSGYFRPASVSFLGNTTGTIQGTRIGVSYVDFDDSALKIDYEFPWATLTSVSSYTDVRSGNNQDLDMTRLSLLYIDLFDNSNTFAQEIRLTSPSTQRLRWSAGAYYFTQNRFRSLSPTINVNPVSFEPSEEILFTPPPAAQKAANENNAFFGQINYDVLDNLEATIAFRIDSDKRTDVTQNRSRTFDEFQPKASLAYRLTPDLLTYATVGKGYRSGGFNNVAPGSQFAPDFTGETLINYELGMKSTLANRRITLNAAVFHIDYSDQQFFVFDATGTQAIVQAPKSTINGAEIEMVAQVTEGLRINAALGGIDSKIDEFNDVPGVLVPASQIVGKKVPNSPEWSATLSAAYERPLTSGIGLETSADYQYRGRTYFTLDNVDTQDPYGILNARASLVFDKYKVTVFAENLLDEEYSEWFFAARFVGLPADLSWPSAPRMFGVQFTADF
ncbi:MAG: TonB-dependent receptor [Planctomycetia bacterium]|nr:TonB-dependent receptor [Planctomycetia bacterium]